MSHRLKIAVSQADMKHSLGIIRVLARQGHEMHGLSSLEPRFSPARRSRFCHHVHQLAQEEEHSFVEGFTALQKVERFDVLIPVGVPVTTFAARRFAELSGMVKLVCPRAEAVEAAEDKLEMARLAETAGVPHPRTVEVTSRASLAACGAQAGFPHIIKGRYEGTTGGYVVKVDSPEALGAAFDGFCLKFGFTQPEQFPILQEFIPGWGCGYFAICQNGRIKREFMHRRLRELPPSGGPSCCAESLQSADLRREGRRLLEALNWNGVAMVEFRCDARDGQFKLMEVNPKFWGSLELALEAGADFAGDYVKAAMGEDLALCEEFRQVRLQWVLGGDLLHALTTRGSRWPFLRDLCNPRTRSDLRLSDPRLLIFRCVQLVRHLARCVIRRRPLY